MYKSEEIKVKGKKISNCHYMYEVVGVESLKNRDANRSGLAYCEILEDDIEYETSCTGNYTLLGVYDTIESALNTLT